MEDKWTHYMLAGEFEKAWMCSDDVLKARVNKPCRHLPRHLQYIWNGATLQNKEVLVRCYHGLGDTIQFVRYLPLLKGIAKRVIVWAQEPLVPLLKTVDGIDELLTLHEGEPEIHYDADIEIMELPYFFRTTLDTIPATIPYLHVVPKEPLQKPTVGLVWKAGNWDERQSIKFALLAPLFSLSGIDICILQDNAKAAGWKKGFGIDGGQYDLYTYAQIVKGLDLLITVDSMPAHLAGALGTPVWTLLHASADWRWMLDREDSPWYPGMRLFRQKQAGNWEHVIANVCHALEEHFAGS